MWCCIRLGNRDGNIHVPTPHLASDKVRTSYPGGFDELEEVHHMFSLQSLHHGMDGDEGTCTTHTITGKGEGEGKGEGGRGGGRERGREGEGKGRGEEKGEKDDVGRV